MDKRCLRHRVYICPVADVGCHDQLMQELAAAGQGDRALHAKLWQHSLLQDC